MLTGRIQSLHVDKGFGFIRPETNGADVFFHHTSLDGEFRTLVEGQSVVYDLRDDGDRPRAGRVRLGGQRPATRGPSARTKTSPSGKRPFSREAPSRSASRARSADRERRTVERRPNCQRGFVTKLRYDEPHGFISADKGGTEIRFEPPVVVGDKRFNDLTVGDYVEFAVRAETADTKVPEADYVREIERLHHFPQTQLSRHPKARRKKPTWR